MRSASPQAAPPAGTRTALWTGTRPAEIALSPLARLLSVVVWLLTLRPVLPGAYDLLVHGRPAPGLARAMSIEARALGLVLAALLVLVTVRALLRSRSTGTAAAAGVAWLAYLALELVSTAWNGVLPLVPVGTGLLVLLVVARAGPLPSTVVPRLVQPLLLVLYSSLALAVLVPETAKFGDPSGTWLSRDSRLAGVLDQPNQIGLLAGVTLVLLASAQHGRTRWRPVHLAVALSALLLSVSFTSVAATTVALLVLWSGQSLRRYGGVPQALVVGTLAAVAHHVLTRWSGVDETLSTVSGRRLLWDLVAQDWRERPLLGHGSGVWSALIADGSLEPWVVHAHNQVLNTLYVGGAAGLLALAVAVAGTAAAGASLWARGAALPLALLVLQLVRCYSEVPFELVHGGLNLLYLTLVLLVLSTASPRRPEETT